MEAAGQAFLIMLLLASAVIFGMIGHRLKTYHDGLVSAAAFTMLLRAAFRYLDLDLFWSIYVTWIPLATAVLLFGAVVRRYAELDTIREICKHYDRCKGRHNDN